MRTTASLVKSLPVSEAIRQVGGVTRLARVLSCTRTSIYRWIKDGADLPEVYYYRFKASQGRKHV